MNVRLLAIALAVATVVAGCSSPKKDTKTDGTPALQVTQTTGGIRGLVVDQAIVPVQGALVVLSGGANRTTGADGLFNFTGLEEGDYFLKVTRLGYVAAQSSAHVVANDPNPPIVKVLLSALSTAKPYVDSFKLDGFYECASSVSFDVDTCDWVYRTGWDKYNETEHQPPPGAPRSFFAYVNTQYIDIPVDTDTIIQEGFWEDEHVPGLWTMVDATPIDAACDCSDHYGSLIGANPTFLRLDRYKADGSNNTEFHDSDGFGSAAGHFPLGVTVAARGFLPPAPTGSGTDPQAWYTVAQNFKFTLITSVFHNQPAPDGWTFLTKDQYKIG